MHFVHIEHLQDVHLKAKIMHFCPQSLLKNQDLNLKYVNEFSQVYAVMGLL